LPRYAGAAGHDAAADAEESAASANVPSGSARVSPSRRDTYGFAITKPPTPNVVREPARQTTTRARAIGAPVSPSTTRPWSAAPASSAKSTRRSPGRRASEMRQSFSTRLGAKPGASLSAHHQPPGTLSRSHARSDGT